MAGDVVTPVILSGGSGTRLWPWSRPERPKQLLSVTQSETLLELTLQRVRDAAFSPAVIVANAAHAEEIEAQVKAVSASAPATLILEPVGRNTAAAIALAAFSVGGGATPLLVMPSDHVIQDVAAFREAVARALPLAREGWLVTFGIEPDRPETGYGYIELGAPVKAKVGQGVLLAASFVEKPDIAAASRMVEGGGYAWNAGIFLFRADAYLEALASHAPAIGNAARRAMESAARDGNRITPDAALFSASPSVSVDYAIMEKSDRVAVVPVSMGWSDVGSWDALYDLGEADGDGNVVHGDVVALDSRNCLFRATDRLVVAVGVEDLVVIETCDAILIVPRGETQRIRDVADALRARATHGRI